MFKIYLHGHMREGKKKMQIILIQWIGLMCIETEKAKLLSWFYDELLKLYYFLMDMRKYS